MQIRPPGTLQDSFLQRRRYPLACAILIGGLTLALTVYLTAPEDSGSELVAAFQGSKAFRHELEAYGGKASVLANEFTHWFDSLWHGKSLAFSIAAIAVLLAGALLLVTQRLPEDRTGASGDHNGSL